MWRVFALIFFNSCYAATLDPLVVLAKKTPADRDDTVNFERSPFAGFDELLLRRILGVTVIETGAPGQLTYARIQGAPSKQSPVVWNGFPMASEDLALIPLNSGVIEVKKGVRCAEFGSGAIGGALNAIPFEKPADLNGEASVNLGNYRYFDTSLWWKKKIENLELLQHFEDSTITSGNPVAKRYRDRYFTRKLAFSAKKRFLNRFKIDTARGEFSALGGVSSLSALGANKMYNPADYRAKQSLQIYGCGWKTERTLKTRPYFQTLYTKRISKFFASADESSFTKHVAENANLRAGVILSENAWEFESGFETLYQGLEQRMFGFERKRYSRGEFALVQGVGFKKNNLKVDNKLRVQKPEHGDTVSALSSDWSLRLNETTLSCHVGTGFRIPSLYERFSAYGSPHLRAERAFGVNCGISRRFSFGDLGISLFRTQSEDMIDFLNDKYVNHKRAVQEGAEIDYAKKFGFKFIKAYFTYTDAVFKKPFEKSPNVPRAVFGLRMGYDDDITFCELSVNYAGKRIQPGYENYREIVNKGGYTTVSVNCERLIADNVKLRFVAENILNREIEPLPGYAGLKARVSLGVVLRW